MKDYEALANIEACRMHGACCGCEYAECEIDDAYEIAIEALREKVEKNGQGPDTKKNRTLREVREQKL